MALPFLGGLMDLSSLETLYCCLTYCHRQPWAAQLSQLVCMTAQQKIALECWRRLLCFPDTYIGFTRQYSISMVCLILVQCYPSFDWHFKPLAQSQTPVNCQDLGVHSTDVNNGDLTPVSNPLHVLATVSNPFAGPVIFSSPLHTPPTPPSPGFPHTPVADPIESDLLAQDTGGVIPDPNPAPKAGANKKPESKSNKILHRYLKGERLFAFISQSISNIL